MPEPITHQADRVLALWQGSWIAAFAVGFLVWGLIIWSVIFHRKRSEQLPPQVRYNLPIEALYTVLPFVIIAVLFYFTARDQTVLMDTEADPASEDVVEIDVLAYQWSWQFTYVGEENVSGDDVAIAGIPGEDPQLVIPNDTTIHFNLESPDVIHSFWVPAFLFKLDVIPGHPNEFQVDLHEDVEGVFEGKCAELCGVDHSQMLFTVRVVDPDEFDEWISEQRDDPESGIEVPAAEELEELNGGTADGAEDTDDADEAAAVRDEEQDDEEAEAATS
ncbi:cytochrome c oxidase subunit II [Lipingzhangella sp. LS1_29]|uniref:cytochrome-c oxidase n=1 Tax=Lipingzhangella rawalii TaxID=2055835 RepID=A0ABU2H223_9ACTN|nr:cytochrome c oxidase subunit II [Lipingzhangella rawalii]MDS1268684.1 cytochrome c oxidase subunit II [Lipingzhangella rawalii]